MGLQHFNFLIIAACLISFATTKPIMVTFGTNNGSITPLDIRPTTNSPNAPKNPAPVFEETEDNPNPNTYRPLVPHQYRSKIYSFKPKPNLILGTPINQKYTPSLEKYNIYRKAQAKSVGVEYTGPHVFERQPYEYDIKPRNNFYQQPTPQPQHHQQKYVPQIGIVYSSGVRYYVPQLVYDYAQDEQENSVYEKDDVKQIYYQRKY